ncbi:MAG TPA: DUF445 family protein [Balneolales bacterium]|nr:DUF445 family protein [Balneolales bacterium]
MSSDADNNTKHQENEQITELPVNGDSTDANGLRPLWDLIVKYGPASGSDKQTASEKRNDPDQQKTNHPYLMGFLLGFPYFLLLVFIFSFFWDFAGYSFTIAGMTFRLDGILRIITVSGLIGFGTNWLAITMLFRPLKKRPLLGQGLIPAQKERIAYRLAQAVSRDLINPELIKAKIDDFDMISKYRKQWLGHIRHVTGNADFREELKDMILWYVGEQLNNDELREKIAKSLIDQLERGVEHSQFERFALKTYRLIRGREMVNIVEHSLLSIPEALKDEMQHLDELLDTLPEHLETHSESIESVVTHLIFTLISELDVHDMIEENILGMDESQLEGLIKGTTNEQLRYIQYLGAVLGTIGGLVIWEPVLSIIFLIAASSILVLADSLLHRWRQTQQ